MQSNIVRKQSSCGISRGVILLVLNEGVQNVPHRFQRCERLCSEQGKMPGNSLNSWNFLTKYCRAIRLHPTPLSLSLSASLPPPPDHVSPRAAVWPLTRMTGRGRGTDQGSTDWTIQCLQSHQNLDPNADTCGGAVNHWNNPTDLTLPVTIADVGHSHPCVCDDTDLLFCFTALVTNTATPRHCWSR